MELIEHYPKSLCFFHILLPGMNHRIERYLQGHLVNPPTCRWGRICHLPWQSVPWLNCHGHEEFLPSNIAQVYQKSHAGTTSEIHLYNGGDKNGWCQEYMWGEGGSTKSHNVHPLPISSCSSHTALMKCRIQNQSFSQSQHNHTSMPSCWWLLVHGIPSPWN